MRFSAIKKGALKLKEQFNSLKAVDPRVLKRAFMHFGIGGIAVIAAIATAAPFLSGGGIVGHSEGVGLNGDDQQAVTQRAEQTNAQTVYATETWWKAGIDEYDLVEYTAQSATELSNNGSQLQQEGISFPNISFKVAAPEGGSVAQPTVYPHSWCGTRDISKEYYTVRSVTSGAIISDNGFDLVCRVLNAEMGAGYPPEALKAQAVAIYSYIRYCDANGMLPVVAVSSSYGSRIEEAVRAVEGQICAYGGSPINALFCASTAGNSQGSEYVWGKSLPYMKPIACKYDNLDPSYGVKTSITAAQLKSIIESKTDITLDPQDVENWFEITSRSSGKYVDKIKIGGRSQCRVGGKTVNLTAAVLRSSILGNSRLRSTAFDISYSSGVFTFTTYGYGHGVGMSQRGAKMLALKDGLKYDQILRYYYTGVTVRCSSVNGKAEDRYGQESDISGLEEAFPSDGGIDVPDIEGNDIQGGAGNDGVSGDSDKKTETAKPSATVSDASKNPDSPQQSSSTVTTSPESEKTPEPEQSETSLND